MKKEMKLLPVLMPNFLPYCVPTGKRQDGFHPEKNHIPVSSLTKEEAEEYGELMKQEFIKHWERKTNKQ